MLTKLKYFSVAVTDIDAAIKLYENVLGLKQMTTIDDTRWGFKRIMMGDGTDMWVEIVQVVDPNSALARFMRDNAGPGNADGEGVYIIGFETDDINKQVEDAKAAGARVNQDPNMPNVAWIHPLSMRSVFVELQQKRS